MAFKIVTDKKQVWWPADINVPLDDGRVEVQKLDAQFEIIAQTEYDDIMQGKSDAKDLLERVVTGLRQRKKDPKAEDAPILGEGDAPLSFDDAKRLMLGVPYIRVGLYAAYNKVASGQGRVKNS